MKKGSSFFLSFLVVAVAVAASLSGATAWDMDKRCWKLLCQRDTRGNFTEWSRRQQYWDWDTCDCTAAGNKCNNGRNLRSRHHPSEPFLHQEKDDFLTDERTLEDEKEEEVEEEAQDQELQIERAPNNDIEDLPETLVQDLPESFKLRLWWYPFACWQMETRQRKYCTQEVDEYPNKLEVVKCEDVKDEWVFERIQGNFVLIKKLDSEDEDSAPNGMCWEAYDRTKDDDDRVRFSISLKKCDDSKFAQHWSIRFSEDSDSPFIDQHPKDEKKFEIIARISMSTQHKERCCVSQGHHPRPGERLDCQGCSRPQSLTHQSSFWEAI